MLFCKSRKWQNGTYISDESDIEDCVIDSAQFQAEESYNEPTLLILLLMTIVTSVKPPVILANYFVTVVKTLTNN